MLPPTFCLLYLMIRSIFNFLACFSHAAVLFSATAVYSATLFWDGDTGSAGLQDGGGNWNTVDSNRWFNGGYSPWDNAAFDSATFGHDNGNAGTVTLVEPITAQALTFFPASTNTYTLAGNATNKLTLAGPATPVITTNLAPDEVTSITAVVAGTQGLIKMGIGTLTLGGTVANEYTGTTEVNAGTLRLDKTAGLAAINGDVVIDGGTLRWNRANQVADTASITLNTGTLYIGGQTETIKSLTINGGTNNGGTSSNGGTFTMTDTLTVTSPGSLGLNSGANWTANTVVFSGSGQALGITGNSTTTIARLTIGAGGLSISGRSISLNTGSVGNALAKGSEILLNGNVTATGVNSITKSGTNVGVGQVNQGNATRTWEVNQVLLTDVTTVAVAIVGAGSGLTKTGNGILLLSGTDANTYDGLTTISAGTLRLGKTAGVDAIAGDIQINAGGKLAFTSSNDQIADTATITLNGGTIHFNNRTETFANLYQIAAGSNVNPDQGNSSIVTITDTLRVSAGSSIILNSGGMWTVHSSEFVSPFSGTAIGFNGNSNNNVNRYTVGIGGSGGLSLSGQNINLARGTNDGGTPATTAKGSELVLNANLTASGNNNINVSGAGTIGMAQVNLNGGQREFNITAGTTTSHAPIVSTTITVTGDGATPTAGGITKLGAGSLVLNAANSYSGNTVIEAGTLRLGSAGAIDASPQITVANGAFFDVASVSGGYAVKANQTLEGGGTVTGSTILNSGAVLSAGTVGGDLTQTFNFSANLTLEAGSSTLLDLGTPTFTSLDAFGGNAIGSAGYNAYVQAFANAQTGDHDRLVIGGTLNQADGARFAISPYDFSPQFGQIFNLLDWQTAFNPSSNLGDLFRTGADDDLLDLDLPNISSSGYLWDISHFTSHGLITIVPEPSRTLLLFVGLATLLSRRKRCR